MSAMPQPLRASPASPANQRVDPARPGRGLGDVPRLHRYHHTHLILRKRLLDGTYARDALLPGERALAAEFGLARITVRSALAVLAREGLVERKRGRGTIATPPPPVRHEQSARELDAFDMLFESFLEVGLRSRVRVLDLRTVPAPDPVAAMLALPPRAIVCRATRVRVVGGTPMSHTVAWFDAERAVGLTRRELAARPLLSWLQRCGVRMEQADETLGACGADPDVASALDVPVGSALLTVRRVFADGEDRPQLLIQGQFRPDRYRYRLHLARENRRAQVWVVAGPDGRPETTGVLSP